MPASWVLEAIYVVKEGWVSQGTFMTIEEVEGTAWPWTYNNERPWSRPALYPVYQIQAPECGPVRFRHMRAAVASRRFRYETIRWSPLLRKPYLLNSGPHNTAPRHPKYSRRHPRWRRYASVNLSITVSASASPHQEMLIIFSLNH
jgi:hypothetical protein